MRTLCHSGVMLVPPKSPVGGTYCRRAGGIQTYRTGLQGCVLPGTPAPMGSRPGQPAAPATYFLKPWSREKGEAQAEGYRLQAGILQAAGQGALPLCGYPGKLFQQVDEDKAAIFFLFFLFLRRRWQWQRSRGAPFIPTLPLSLPRGVEMVIRVIDGEQFLSAQKEVTL